MTLVLYTRGGGAVGVEWAMQAIETLSVQRSHLNGGFPAGTGRKLKFVICAHEPQDYFAQSLNLQ